LRQDLGGRLIEVHPALLDQLHRRGRGEGFGHRKKPEDRVVAHRRTGLDISVAERAVIDDPVRRGSHRRDAEDRAVRHRLA
jgi:hypothetical protein